MVAIPEGELIWGLKFRGIGPTSPTGVSFSRYRWATERPAFDTLGLYEDSLGKGSPGRVGWSVDFRDGSSTISSLRFKLITTARVLREFGLLRSFASTSIVSAISATDTNVELGTAFTGNGGSVIWAKREAMSLDLETGPGMYDVTRGYHGTTPQAFNPAVPTEDVEVFQVNHVLQNRGVELFYVNPNASGYADEVTVWTGTLEDVEHSEGTAALQIVCKGALGMLNGSTFLKRQWQGKVEGLDVSKDNQGNLLQMNLVVYPDVPEWSYEENLLPFTLSATPSAGDKALVEFGGSVFEMVLARIDDVNVYTVDLLRPFLRLTPAITEQQARDLQYSGVKEVFISAPEAPNSLGPNVFDILLRTLTSTSEGENGPDDLGIDLGIGMDFQLIDRAGILVLKNLLGPLAVADRFHLGIDSREDVQDKLEALLSAFDLVFTQGPTGLLGVAVWADLPVGYVEETITEDDLLIPANGEQGWTSVLDSIRYLYTPALHFLDQVRSVQVNDSIRRKRLTGSNKELEIDGTAVSDYWTAYQQALGKLLRYRDPLPIIEVKAQLSTNLTVGRTVLLTTGSVVGQDAGVPVEGVTSSRCMVLSKDIDLLGNSITYELAHIGVDVGNLGRISFSGRVSNYSAGIVVAVTLEPNDFVPVGGNGVYMFDIDACEALYTVQFLDANGTSVIPPVLVVNKAGNALEFAGPLSSASRPSGPIAGDIVVFADYAATTTSQREHGDAWIADPFGNINGVPGSEPGMEYTQ